MDSSPETPYTLLFDGEEVSPTQKTDQHEDRSTHPSSGETIPDPRTISELISDYGTPSADDDATSAPTTHHPEPTIDDGSTSEPMRDILRESQDHQNYPRLKEFVPPRNAILKKVPVNLEGRSIIYDTGIIVTGTGEQNGKEVWQCLLGSCKSTINIGRNKSNITDHLRKQHKVESNRREKLMQAQVDFKTKLSKEKLMMLKMKLCRYHQINVVKFGIKQMLPFGFTEHVQFRTTIEMLDHRNEFQTQLHNKTVKKLILELYLATAAEIKKIEFAGTECGLPFLHINVDLWTSRISGEKYFGARVFFVDQDWVLQSSLLAIRKFRPHSSLTEEGSKYRLSDILKLWTERILGEFGVNTHSLFSKVTNSGSDVKRLCSSLLPGKWDWCLVHLRC